MNKKTCAKKVIVKGTKKSLEPMPCQPWSG
jgi:hypothetical protein